MKLAMMAGGIGTLVAPAELRPLGFEAVQMFFGSGPDGDAQDPSAEAVDELLGGADVALAAMTLHVGLVGPQGALQDDVDRAVRCVEKTAALDGRFGDNDTPVLIWHPSPYPATPEVDDTGIRQGLCDALGTICRAAERTGVRIAVEITRAGSIGSAESFLWIKEGVASEALGVCLDAANFTPDRTPLERAVRMLGPHTIIGHGKDVSFNAQGIVAHYGPTGSGTLDYTAYMSDLQAYVSAPYFVLEYYGTRDELLKARDIVRQAMASSMQ